MVENYIFLTKKVPTMEFFPRCCPILTTNFANANVRFWLKMKRRQNERICCVIFKKNHKKMNNRPPKLQLEQNDGKTEENYFFDKKRSNNGNFFSVAVPFQQTILQMQTYFFDWKLKDRRVNLCAVLFQKTNKKINK